ncbi:gamma-glutamylcyclotransferase [Usitatibacter palustris]|uniref:glutathione-specific gamma-glutamylcyclotransferase n=1 Tax=Usitatibacter palustris TaxID=2732487 RepID=A0A6M4H3L5_9PROT|nr:gamma-glutamylcyclotransferase [Usitatibacter palustris]QJR14116.1 Glutathione-specific gamma-glutamylcyclotransferase [Usitatibacter palustris]
MANSPSRPLNAPHGGYAPPPEAATPLTPTELLASLRAALEPWTPGTPFWIFAYGSLMWNPSFSFDARHVATVRGYHRSFRVWSRINRGTPENPGLVLTLECGGSCRGLIYRIAPDRVQEEMGRIWKREMNYGSYRPKWLNCSVGDETIRALVFTVNRTCTGYSGAIPEDIMVQALASAAGRYGPAHDYLFKTTETLRAHGIRDARVEHLAGLVRAKMGTA